MYILIDTRWSSGTNSFDIYVMTLDDMLRRLRGALGNAVVWGAGWFTAAFAIIAVVIFFGLFPEAKWLDAFSLAARFGIVGGVAGGAFAGFMSLVYRGRRLSELSWVRFGIGGAVVTAVFVPLFLQTMNLLSGDGLVAWNLVLDDAIWTSVFGGSAAGGSLWIAQRSGPLLERGGGSDGDRSVGAAGPRAHARRVSGFDASATDPLSAADARALDPPPGDARALDPAVPGEGRMTS